MSIEPDFRNWPREITGENPIVRQARLIAQRQHNIDEMSAIFGTPVHHSALKAAQDLPHLLSPYLSVHEPIVGIDRVFGEYLRAQAKLYMLRITGMAVANRIERAEVKIKERLRKQFAGEYEIPSDKPIPSEQVDLLMAKQQLVIYQDQIDCAEKNEAKVRLKYENAMATCAKKITEMKIP